MDSTAGRTAGAYSPEPKPGSAETQPGLTTHSSFRSGNADGVDHGQDQFVLLLNPAIAVSRDHNKVSWNVGHTGSSGQLFTVFASELQNPASMRPSVAEQLRKLNFADADFKRILSADAFAANLPIDPKRYVPTTWTFPYEPALASTDCNGGVCSCLAFTQTLKNDLQTEKASESSLELSISFSEGAGLSDILELQRKQHVHDHEFVGDREYEVVQSIRDHDRRLPFDDLYRSGLHGGALGHDLRLLRLRAAVAFGESHRARGQGHGQRRETGERATGGSDHRYEDLPHLHEPQRRLSLRRLEGAVQQLPQDRSSNREKQETDCPLQVGGADADPCGLSEKRAHERRARA